LEIDVVNAPRDEINDFLRRVRGGLAALPSDIREDLVAELRSHLDERAEQGKLNVAGEFGSPEAYAARLMAEHNLAHAVSKGTPVSLIVTLISTVRATALTFFVILPLATIEIIALGLMVMGIAKPFYGDHIGVFRGADGHGALGWVSDVGSMHEVTGYAGTPAFIFAGLVLFWIGNRLLLRIARYELLRMRGGSV
jgi:Protein of unknown function (DUF1700)